mmetsp:Transcript_45664/g.85260  ORF Transcript_45664/g.85260 Transcript_45664/m.85260 type:complete len:834 (+) Transcript_45664:68-2569(+)
MPKLVLALLLGLAARAWAVADFIEPKDRNLARKADMKADEACAIADEMDMEPEEREKRYDQLVGASADNLILDILREADDEAAMQAMMEERALNPGFLLFAAGPLVGFIFFLVLYLLYFCWAPCPCCWCCPRKRSCPIIVKILWLILVGGIVFGLIIAASLSMRGFDAANKGFEVTQCTAAQLVNTTMSGSSDPPFLGVIRTLEILQDLKNSLDPGSRFLNDLQGILTNTQDITDAVLVASSVMTSLETMMSAPENLVPKDTSGADLLHKCELCEVLVQPLSDANEALNSGIGAALAATREEVENQLTGDNLASLSDSMLAGADPLIELKAVIHSAFGPFVEQDVLPQVSDVLASFGTLSSVALIGFALLLAACSVLTGICWICVDKTKGDDGESKHRRCTHRCACCTWCCGCYYMLFVLLISGIMTAVAIPLSSVCLLLEDVDKEMINDIGGPLGVNLTGQTGQMMGDMIEQCFQNADGNARLLDLIEVNGTTLYVQLVNETRDAIDGQFDALLATMDAPGGGDLSGPTTPVGQLISTLRNTDMASMILPDVDKLTSTANQATYGAMFLPGSYIEDYAMSGAKCSDDTVPNDPDFGDIAGDTIYGISAFATALQSGTGRSPAASGASICGSTMLKANCNTAADLECAAGNNFMDLKIGLRTGDIYKCQRFVRPNGAECFVSASGGNAAHPDLCLINGEVSFEEYDCNIDEFANRVQKFANDLDAVFSNLDTVANSLKDTISDDLKELVRRDIIGKITTIADGLTCGFLGVSYQGVIDGLCYGGVWGFTAMAASYVACGVLTILLVIITFIVWRIAYDNVLTNQREPIQKYES